MTASGCGVMVKDYAHLLADDPEYAEKAERVSLLTKDASEFFSKRGKIRKLGLFLMQSYINSISYILYFVTTYKFISIIHLSTYHY